MAANKVLSTQNFSNMLDKYAAAVAEVSAQVVAGDPDGIASAEKVRDKWRLKLHQWAVEAVTLEK